MLIDQMRHRMMTADDYRRKDREQIGFIILIEKFLLGSGKLSIADVLDTVGFQIIHSSGINMPLELNQTRNCVIYFRQLLRCCHAAFVIFIIGRYERDIIQTADAHHEKFVQVAAENRHKI